MRLNIAVLFSLCLLSACTEPGRSTAVGATAGGVLGASVGAIVGNQVGNTGSGLAIGAAAGAGAGGAIGNMFDAQDKVIKNQEEAMVRQGRQISIQQGQLNELRKLSQDQVSYKDSPSVANETVSRNIDTSNYGINTLNAVNNVNSYAATNYGNGAYGSSTIQPVAVNSPITSYGRIRNSAPTKMPPSVIAYNKLHGIDPIEAVRQESPSFNDVATTALAANRVAASNTVSIENTSARIEPQQVVNQLVVKEQPVENIANDVTQPVLAKDNIAEDDTSSMRASYSWTAPQEVSDDCREADKEATTAKNVSSLADQLYHYRRALRLCPDNPIFHNAMGEVYMSLQRSSDAVFEFKEAVKLDPNYSLAASNLRKAESGGNNMY